MLSVPRARAAARSRIRAGSAASGPSWRACAHTCWQASPLPVRGIISEARASAELGLKRALRAAVFLAPRHAGLNRTHPTRPSSSTAAQAAAGWRRWRSARTAATRSPAARTGGADVGPGARRGARLLCIRELDHCPRRHTIRCARDNRHVNRPGASPPPVRIRVGVRWKLRRGDSKARGAFAMDGLRSDETVAVEARIAEELLRAARNGCSACRRPFLQLLAEVLAALRHVDDLRPGRRAAPATLRPADRQHRQAHRRPCPR